VAAARVTLFTWLWLGWGAMFVAVEGVAIAKKDKPDRQRTLTANVRWLIKGRAPGHKVAWLGVILLLAWLPLHFLFGMS
jgi:hypothetical protein